MPPSICFLRTGIRKTLFLRFFSRDKCLRGKLLKESELWDQRCLDEQGAEGRGRGDDINLYRYPESQKNEANIDYIVKFDAVLGVVTLLLS
jgi:hypothetical protein